MRVEAEEPGQRATAAGPRTVGVFQRRKSLIQRHRVQWDNAGGVPPGIYIVELTVGGDTRSEALRRTIAVAY